MGDTYDDIAELLIPSETLEYAGKRFKLYGLGLPEITFIARMHSTALEPLYQIAASGNLQADPATIAFQLADEFGPVVALVVACSMRRPEAIEKVQLLPFPVLADALNKIIRITLSNEGGVEKLMEIVTQALAAMAKQKPLKP